MSMATKAALQKVECLNPNTGGKKFNGSVGWYAVTVKHDMHSGGVIEVFTEKGKKLHLIKK